MKRDLLRNEAKKLYKEQTKGIPKKQRLPFAEFFKQYKILKVREGAEVNAENQEEDFDFGELVNEISDEDLVTEENVVIEENNEEEDNDR